MALLGCPSVRELTPDFLACSELDLAPGAPAGEGSEARRVRAV
jgi:hypothetical protein